MCSVPIETAAADRARWLAELSRALREAQHLLFELDLSAVLDCETGELFQSIEAAQFEVRSLQLSRFAQPRSEKRPKWMELAPWQPEAD